MSIREPSPSLHSFNIPFIVNFYDYMLVSEREIEIERMKEKKNCNAVFDDRVYI